MIKKLKRFYRAVLGIGYVCPLCKYDHAYEKRRAAGK